MSKKESLKNIQKIFVGVKILTMPVMGDRCFGHFDGMEPIQGFRFS